MVVENLRHGELSAEIEARLDFILHAEGHGDVEPHGSLAGAGGKGGAHTNGEIRTPPAQILVGLPYSVGEKVEFHAGAEVIGR